MSDIAQQRAPETEAAPYRWRWAAFAVVLAGSVMDLLDSLATNVAGPSIRADIGGGPTLLQWLLAGYTLAMAVGLITGGRLGDIYARRLVLLAGLAGFTIGSILCSIATQPGELIAFRVVQGLFDLLTRNLHAHASQQAFTRTLGQTLWVAVALQAATFALAFLLPRRARPQWNGAPGPGDGTTPDGGQAATPAAEPA
jgi:MFS family permease